MYRPLHKWFLCAMVYLTRLRAGQKNWERFRCFLGVVAVFPLVWGIDEKYPQEFCLFFPIF